MKGLLLCLAFVWGVQLIKGPFCWNESLMKRPAGIGGRTALPPAFPQQGKWEQELGAALKGTLEFAAIGDLKGLVTG